LCYLDDSRIGDSREKLPGTRSFYEEQLARRRENFLPNRQTNLCTKFNNCQKDATVCTSLYLCRQLHSSITDEYLPYDTHESVPSQQRERMVVDRAM